MYRTSRRVVCLLSESGKDHRFYLENYYCRVDISPVVDNSKIREDLLNDYIKNLCRKSFTVEKLKPNGEMTLDDKKKAKTTTIENQINTAKSNAKIFATLTATYLDWCLCTKLQTGSADTANFACNFVSNHWMRMSNGNGKVKDTLDIQYQNIPGTLGVEEVGTVLDTLISRSSMKM